MEYFPVDIRSALDGQMERIDKMLSGLIRHQRRRGQEARGEASRASGMLPYRFTTDTSRTRQDKKYLTR